MRNSTDIRAGRLRIRRLSSVESVGWDLELESGQRLWLSRSGEIWRPCQKCGEFNFAPIDHRRMGCGSCGHIIRGLRDRAVVEMCLELLEKWALDYSDPIRAYFQALDTRAFCNRLLVETLQSEELKTAWSKPN